MIKNSFQPSSNGIKMLIALMRNFFLTSSNRRSLIFFGYVTFIMNKSHILSSILFSIVEDGTSGLRSPVIKLTNVRFK